MFTHWGLHVKDLLKPQDFLQVRNKLWYIVIIYYYFA